jgi:hypothetical protein
MKTLVLVLIALTAGFVGSYLNPGKIRALNGPHRRLPLGIGVANTEPRLLNMLSAATREMALSGKLEQIIKANEEFPDTYGRNLLTR